MKTSVFPKRAANVLGACILLAIGSAATAQVRVPQSGDLLRQVAPAPQPKKADDTGLQMAPQSAAQPVDSAPVHVTTIEVTGATLLPGPDLHALVASGEGQDLTIGQLNDLAARITAAYRAHGYPLTVAYLPPQTLSGGTVRIAVQEARLGKVILQNQSKTHDGPLQATLDPLKPGMPVSDHGFDRSLLLLGDIPGVRENSVLRPGDEPGTSDLLVSTEDRPRYTGTVGLDDYGNRYTGRARMSGSFSVNGLFHQGDVLDASALTAGSNMNYGRLGYRYLLNGQGTVVGASVSALDYKLKGDLRVLDAHGTAQVASVFISQPIIRSTDGNLYGQLGYDRRHLNDSIDIVGLRTLRHTNGWTATLAGDQIDAHGVTNFSVAATYGMLGFNDYLAEFIDAISAQTRGHYLKYTLSAARLQVLSENNAIYLGFSGQWSNKNVDTVEQFSLGGPNSLRGYDTGVIAGSQGQMLNLEYRRTLHVGLPGTLIATAFLDGGRVSIYKDRFVPGTNNVHMQDVGVGMRWQNDDQWSVSADLAHPIGARPEMAGETRNLRLWLQVQKGF
ncbi:hemolysin activation/secretion protein [Luteibacter sp. Sphag1AF]|uniref:ShlB/FhaC/HecB family hemolysin secretion/activation protein n=1 Tax=Luteibacter sp. Sphag1AF TaxID=2587031 RepID=UPI0016178456|nr:ShlB/FhaC/HecB family hemolysin secretion/activation protein [Luteibacter sp. Sphag1AF]MBB3228520.1 hemolysin activation/secretion protein [Luteibacter sp. Sphag1AF]